MQFDDITIMTDVHSLSDITFEESFNDKPIKFYRRICNERRKGSFR